MVELSILVTCRASEWASLAFIILKKDGCIHQITDLCSLNKAIICKQYPLPIITDTLDRISGYKFYSKLDISMQYYTFELDEPSQELYVIVTPFGKYKYKRLPMGLILVGNVVNMSPTCRNVSQMSKFLKLTQMSTTQRIFFILSHVSVACCGHKL